MKLYHGTRLAHLDAILSDGLVPRGKRKSVWRSAPSSPKAVYLTDAYAPYFCGPASHRSDKLGLVVEIETDLLQLQGFNLVPDEDAVEQVNRGKDNIPGDYLERTKFYRKNLGGFLGDGNWRISLQALGTCAHLGIIPPSAITRIAKIPLAYGIWWDATISVMNYKFCGEKYRNQMKRLFGDTFEADPNAGWQDCRIPLDGHEVFDIEDKRLVRGRKISLPDERELPKFEVDAA